MVRGHVSSPTLTLPPDGALRPFHAMEILARAKALEGAGRDICHLEVGEPAVPPAPEVRAAVAAALDGAQLYTNAKGQIELRRRLSRFYQDTHRVEVDPEAILVTMGSSAAFIIAFLASFRVGARIAVTRPYYPAYINTVDALGMIPVEIPLTAEHGWRLGADDVEAAYRRQPFDGLLFASPANPTGASVTPAALAAIAAACRRLGVRLISDEIYHGLDFGAASATALAVSPDAVVINSFSKYHCMTGWRIGWLVLPPDLVRRAEMLQQNLFISAPTLSQVAARVALDFTDYAEAQKAVYARNRLVIADGLSGLGLSLAGASDGAFYAYADVSPFTDDAMAFCLRLLDEAGVAATPGIDFDRMDGHRYVRFSFAGATGTIEKALERMKRFVGR
jgi:aspartate/methionine/tyrosine aminotransferase